LPVELYRRARLFVDHPEQAVAIGEAQHAAKAGMVSVETLRSHTLGGVLNGRVGGRMTSDEITVFDSSGIAVQDIAAARAALDIVTAALASGQGA
jgi:ornithine cyclodeaminase/alanine dehydrogenase-like protein (mu-crystallin family)